MDGAERLPFGGWTLFQQASDLDSVKSVNVEASQSTCDQRLLQSEVNEVHLAGAAWMGARFVFTLGGDQENAVLGLNSQIG